MQRKMLFCSSQQFLPTAQNVTGVTIGPPPTMGAAQYLSPTLPTVRCLGGEYATVFVASTRASSLNTSTLASPYPFASFYGSTLVYTCPPLSSSACWVCDR